MRRCFGPYTFDPDSGDLTRDGAVERLSPQTAQILRLFLDRPGAVISRAELKERIWPDTTVEFDQGLSFCIRQLRIALGDEANQPRYIETLPKRGYRFIAAVTEAPTPSATPTPVADAPPPRPRRDRRRWAIGLTAFTALVVLVVTAALRSGTFRGAVPIAVVPFDADSSVRSVVDYRDRLAEATVERLTNGAGDALRVMGPATTHGFTSRSPVDSVRAHSGAAFTLSGVVRPRDRGIEVFSQLIRADDRGHIWVARWIDSSATSPGAMGERIADSVRAVLLNADRSRANRIPRR